MPPALDKTFYFEFRDRTLQWGREARLHHSEIQGMPEVNEARIRSSGNFNWTVEKVLEAAALWEDGKSARQIATRFGLHKNAVSGIVHRCRPLFPSRPSPIMRG